MNKATTNLTNEEFLHLLKLVVAFSSQRTLTSITMERSLAIFDSFRSTSMPRRFYSEAHPFKKQCNAEEGK